MKFAELKTKFRHKYAIRVAAGVLIVALVGGGTFPCHVWAAKGAVTKQNAENTDVSQKQIGKEETVYVLTNNQGVEKKVIVSDHLINNDDKATIEDVSSLKDIKNVKGEETFTQKGTKLTWQADGNDIYYQGNTDEKLPVSQKITYYLDGKEMSAEEIAGKSGKITIRFDYTNHEKVKVSIDGKKEEICVPFVAISGMVLDESFSNVEVSNGKIMADGNNSIVMGYTLPGLKESLAVKDSDFEGDVTIPEYFEVTADVENFSLATAMTVVMNATELVDGENKTEFSEMDDMVDALTDATSQLEDGSAELAAGMDTLKSKMGEFSQGVGTLQDGVQAYTTGTATLAEGIGKLHQSTPELANGVNTLNSSANTLYQGVQTLDTTLKAQFSEQEKAALTTQVNDTLSKKESEIKASAKASVDTQAASIKTQAEAAVDAQTAAITSQAEAAVDAQAAAITSQAEAAVDAQAAAITSQAEAAVDAQTAAIISQAEATVDATFANGQYAAIKQSASEQLGQALSGSAVQLTEGIKGSNAYPVILAGVKATIAGQMGVNSIAEAQAAFDAQNGAGAFEATAAAQADAMITEMTSQAVGALVPQVQEAASTAVADAALAGAKSAAGQAAVSGAKAAAGPAAVSGARAAAGQAAVSGAKGAAGTAAVSAATAAAQSAAYEGAKGAAGTAAISAAEQTKKTIADSINQVGDSGYSLVSGVKALSEGTKSLADAVPQLVDGINQLNSGSQTLVANNASLNEGTAKLSEGTGALCEGIDELNDGAHQLADGIVEFNEEGIQKMLDAYTGDIEPLTQRLEAVMDAGESYQCYTDIAEGVNGSVKFIYKMDAVKVEE